MINIVYPLVESEWGEEIKYSLRSLDKFIQIEFRVIIYGTYKPDWLDTSKVDFILMPKFIPIVKGTSTQFNQGLIYQMLIARTDIDDFIFFNDDIYLLQPIFNFNRVYMLDSKFNSAPPKSKNTWHKLLYNTRKDLAYRKCTTFNFETHLPYLINCQKLSKLKSVLKGEKLLATTYFNIYDVGAKPLVSTVKIGCYGPVNAKILGENLFEMNKSKFENANFKFFNHNNGGLPLAKFVLPKLFPNPSKFELCL